jgi:hypothetical protein
MLGSYLPRCLRYDHIVQREVYMAQSSKSPRNQLDWGKIAVLAVIVILFIGIIVWAINLGKNQGLIKQGVNKLTSELPDLNARFERLANHLIEQRTRISALEEELHKKTIENTEQSARISALEEEPRSPQKKIRPRV